MNETSNERLTFKERVSLKLNGLKDWIASQTPEGKINQSQQAFTDSLNNLGAGTQLWMTELTRQQLEERGELTPDYIQILNNLIKDFSEQMTTNGGDPEQLLSQLRQPKS
jgi:hypothetical protein